MKTGVIIQIIGAVIDVKFSSKFIPKIYHALQVDTAKKNFSSRSTTTLRRWNC